MQKFLLAGLALAFLGFIIGSMSEYAFVAGIFFVGVVILGIVGILKMRKSV
jgi:hypothetical protein